MMTKRCRPLLTDGALILEERLHSTLALDRERPTASIDRFADRHPDPTLGDAVLLDVRELDPVETDADGALEKRGVMVRAVRVHAQPIGEVRRHPYRMPCLAAAVTAWLAAMERRVPPESGAPSAMQIR